MSELVTENTGANKIEIITGSGNIEKTVDIYNAKNIIKIENALLIEYKDNSMKLIQDFKVCEDACHKKDEMSFKDYVKSYPDASVPLLEFVYDKSTLKDNDIIVVNNGNFNYVKDVNLDKINLNKQLFNKDSLVAYLPFDGTIFDLTKNFNPMLIGTAPKYIDGKFNQAILSQYTGGGDTHDTSVTQIKIGVVNKDSDVVTISAWLKWNKNNGVMAFGFNTYDFYFYNNWIGFNTANSDIYGVDNKLDWSTFHHFVVEFHQGKYGKLWIDGVEQNLTQKKDEIDSSSAVIKNTDFHIFGWGNDSSYRNFGAVDEVFIFNRALTNDEIKTLYLGNYNVIKKLTI